MTRDQLIREIRKLARKTGRTLEIDTKLGKGSHIAVRLGGHTTIIKSGELKPGYVRLIKKQLGIE